MGHIYIFFFFQFAPRINSFLPFNEGILFLTPENIKFQVYSLYQIY